MVAIAALSLIVTRVATVVLVATGTARHVARFQARSALTGRASPPASRSAS